MTGNTLHAPSRVFKRQLGGENLHVSGWDTIPVVLSPQTAGPPDSMARGQNRQSRNCDWKTPQHLFTLSTTPFVEKIDKVNFPERSDDDGDNIAASSTSCPPLLWNERYIVVAVSSGDIFLFGKFGAPLNVNSLPLKVQPLTSLSFPSEATVVALKPLSTENGQSDSLLAVTLEGQVYRIRLNIETKPTAEDGDALHRESMAGERPVGSKGVDEATDVVSLIIENSWDTGRCGVTSLEILPEKEETVTTAQNSFSASTTSLVFVGNESGEIDTWRLFLDKPKRRPKFLWRGVVEEMASVHSIGTLLRKSQTSRVDTESTETRSREDDGNGDEGLRDLVVCWSSILREGPPVVRLFDLSTIYEASKKLSRPLIRGAGSEGSSDLSMLKLSEHVIAPDPAMDFINLKDSSSNSLFDGLHDLDDVLSYGQGTNTVLTLENGSKCALALSDCTAAILSSGWGVGCDANQLALAYPAIGVGSAQVSSKRTSEEVGEPTEHILFCLRGGTCYTVPLDQTDSDPVPKVSAIAFPHDCDADSTNVYVQSFTAGNLQVNEKDGTIPVLIFAWAGGLIDIYSPSLLLTEHDIPTEDEQVLKEMVQNGSIDLIIQILESLEKQPSHELHNDTLWKAAFDEFRHSTSQQQLSFQELSQQKALRKLLLHQATPEP